MPPPMIRPLTAADWPAAAAIFKEGIETGHATFETASPAWAAWDASHLPECRLVCEEGGGVLGFAALSPYSGRRCYRGVAEVMVYVAAAARGRGVGKTLLQSLIAASEDKGFWTLQAGIFPENKTSVALHEKCGFRVVGVREKLGQMQGRWRDVLLLERRSGKF